MKEISKMYTEDPLTMHCDRPDGREFDGFNWEGAPAPKLPKSPTPIPKSCSKSQKSLQNTLECDEFGECIYSPQGKLKNVDE